jgi:hypothetical protein
VDGSVQEQQEEQQEQKQGRPHSYTASPELVRQLATSGERWFRVRA